MNIDRRILAAPEAPLTPSPTRDRGETLTLAISIASILLFVGIASTVLSQAIAYTAGNGDPVDRTLTIALLLNIALILLGWRRHRALESKVRTHAEAEARARALAARDALTGFLNRRSLIDDGGRMVAQAERRRSAVALLMFDLDHFKTVNDIHGHATGDALLRAISREICGIVPSGSICARIGGDEFAVAIPFDPSTPDTITRIGEQLIDRLSMPIDTGDHHLQLSGSLGIARSDHVRGSIEALMRAADIAMYASKKAGRNRFAWFNETMERELATRNALEQGLREAIPAGQIAPYFEQQVDINTGAITGFEVLARWEHPTRGLIAPEHFIPIAEETGMIADLSMSVMRQAFLCARDWDPSLSVAINISPWQLRDPWLAQKIIKLLTETGLQAGRLEVEITESALFDNLPLAQSIAGSLKNQGIGLILDDFGTGYSSLAHLRMLPFDRIKIDRSFVRSVNETPESTAIVTAIARLGESLNLPVTGEGVENEAIAERLRALGCARAQGWLYGKPLSAIEVRKLLAERHLLHRPGAMDLADDFTIPRLAG